MIRTVLGDVSADTIKQTLIHEHLLKDYTHKLNIPDKILQESPALISEIELAKKAGCDLIVEVTTRGMGRDVAGLKRLSEKLGLHVVCSTGFYKESVYPPEAFEKSRSEIADLFVQEITEGIEDTSIKAGIIAEIGSSLNEVTAAEDKVFRAACDAQKQTGAPISTHCEIGTMGEAQLRIFQAEQVDLSRVSIGHQDLNLNLEEQLLILSSGANLQFDTIGKNSYRLDEDRLQNLLTLLDKGFENQIMLSVDLTRQSYFRANNGPGYVHLFDNFIPALRQAGVTHVTIDKMMVQNPARFLDIH